MAVLKVEGESARTSRRAPAPEEWHAAFQAHYASTMAFTDDLRARRCLQTDHFTDRLGETVATLRPVFAPWNAELLFTLYMGGPRRFNALKKALGGISSRVLTDKLRDLESAGFIQRMATQEGVNVYALSPQGEPVARLLHPIVFYLNHREG